ncbi:MAG: DUF805 domain-containing protein, partial [Elusimicrobiota bacterium]|nr:DUF805 domain-containing protein [Elusimicrobiota bacterium]
MNFFKTYFWDVFVNHYFDFKGKATRKQFWLFIVILYVIVILISVAAIISGFANNTILCGIINFIITFGTLITILSNVTR